MNVAFESEYRWDGDRYAMAFPARTDSRRIVCLISGEALQDYFGASGRHEAMEEAFLRNRPSIESIARALIEGGRVDKSDKVLIRAVDVAACA